MIKFLSNTSLTPTLFHYFPKGFLPISWIGSLQPPIFIEKSQSSCHLRHHHTQKTENQKITIYDKDTFHYPPIPDASPASPNNSYAWSHGSIVSNSPYSFINCHQYFKISSNTKNTGKTMKIGIKVTF